MLKRLDKLLISSFIPPFVVAFCIAVFVLMMQFVWVYIDEIIGKGVEFFTLIELLGYLSVSRIPMALPLGVLIASVMVMGNLAERYELSSFKSAGISLLRVMRPLMVAMALVSVFSFYCSNNLIPIANLKFGSRLYDIRKQKPALSLEEGVFNDDFEDFVLRVKNKLSDGESIEDVLIYNQTNNFDRINQISAKGGKMFTTADKQYFVMQLTDGVQYQELEESNRQNEKYPFVRTGFKKLQKVYDLKEFSLNKTDEELFKGHQMMLTSSQLVHKVDSINERIDERKNSSAELFPRYFASLKLNEKQKKSMSDSLAKATNQNTIKINYPDPPQQLAKIDNIGSFADAYPFDKRQTLITRAKTSIRSMQSELNSLNGSIERSIQARNLHQYELHIKISIAVICFVFLFIGAPMGAIVRKGGFGYPLLISIIYFMVFIVLNILCKNLTDELVINGVMAAWMPVFILAPIGLLLTSKAVNDSVFFDTDRIRLFFAPFVRLFQKIAKINTK
jgi:lipopolysaccharide export system permease protein